MKKFLAILAISASLIACNKPEGIQSIDAATFQSKETEAQHQQLLDVRTSDEFAKGHIEGAINADINLGDFQTQLAKLDKSKPVFVYCLSGGRSSSAAEVLKENGFKEIYNLEGGILAWNAAQLPLSTTSGAQMAGGMSLSDYQKLVASKKSVIVDFHAEWCGPCKKLSPILEKFVEEQKGKVELIKIDVDQNPALAEALKIEAIPYVERYENGNLQWKKLGLFPENELK